MNVTAADLLHFEPEAPITEKGLRCTASVDPSVPDALLGDPLGGTLVKPPVRPGRVHQLRCPRLEHLRGGPVGRKRHGYGGHDLETVEGFSSFLAPGADRGDDVVAHVTVELALGARANTVLAREVVHDVCTSKHGAQIGFDQVELFKREVWIGLRGGEVLLLPRTLVVVGEAVHADDFVAAAECLGDNTLANVSGSAKHDDLHDTF